MASFAKGDIMPSLETTLEDLEKARRRKKDLKRQLKNLLAWIIRRRNKEMYVLPVNHLIWCRKSSDTEGNQMAGSGEEQRETIRPEFNPAIMIDFQGAKITSDTG